MNTTTRNIMLAATSITTLLMIGSGIYYFRSRQDNDKSLNL